MSRLRTALVAAEQARADCEALGLGTTLVGKTSDMLLAQNTQSILSVYDLLRAQMDDETSRMASGEDAHGEYAKRWEHATN